MKYSIDYQPPAAKALRKMERQDAKRVASAITALADNPRPRGCEQLKGGAGEYRIRVGSFRVIYDIRDRELLILVLKVGNRRDVYDH